MNDSILLAGLSLMILLGAMFGLKSQKEQIVLRKEEWNCIKSLMIDEKNVDKVECILYEKQEKPSESK